MEQKAKEFEALNHKNQKIKLSTYKGKKIWLAFYRYASCPLCNLHIHNIIKRFEEIEKTDVVFFPIFQSPVSSIQNKFSNTKLPFDIVCDPDQSIYKLYDVKTSYSGLFSISAFKKAFGAFSQGFFPGKIQGAASRIPSELIINENFDIIYRYDGKDISDHPSIDEILSVIT